jgi:hypothetical protein
VGLKRDLSTVFPQQAVPGFLPQPQIDVLLAPVVGNQTFGCQWLGQTSASSIKKARMSDTFTFPWSQQPNTGKQIPYWPVLYRFIHVGTVIASLLLRTKRFL